MEVLLYGRLADVVGPRLALDVPAGISVGEVRQRLAEAHPALADDMASRRVRACVADAFVGDDQLLGKGQKVEFFPAVSGG